MIEIKCDICEKELDIDDTIICYGCSKHIVEERDGIISELKKENDFLLKRVEELENNLCPSCGNM